MNGLVTFRLGQREYATPLAAVREVVRLQGLADMPGMRPPLAGVLDLRIGAGPDDPGDVLVLERGQSDGSNGLVDGASVGVAVDQVRAVVDSGELRPTGTASQEGLLPAYVVEVLRGKGGVVFLVDLSMMVDGAREHLPVPA